MSIAAVSVGVTATLIIAKNDKRTKLVIDNQSAQTVYLGDGDGVTAANGITLAAGGKREETANAIVPGKDPYFYFGNWYGIVNATTADVRVLELVTNR